MEGYSGRQKLFLCGFRFRSKYDNFFSRLPARGVGPILTEDDQPPAHPEYLLRAGKIRYPGRRENMEDK